MNVFLSWARGRLGRAVDVDGAYGAQCVDLVNDYVKAVWGLPPLRGNAVDLQRERPAGFVWVANGPSNYPAPGSVVVWGGPDPQVGTGPFGHTAVCLASSSMILLTVDQNWPEGSAPAFRFHSYRAVIGWHAPTRALP